MQSVAVHHAKIAKPFSCWVKPSLFIAAFIAWLGLSVLAGVCVELYQENVFDFTLWNFTTCFVLYMLASLYLTFSAESYCKAEKKHPGSVGIVILPVSGFITFLSLLVTAAVMG